ncbi:TetR/AcrR family transcriptional regulator [Streptococcus thoraltensis]|uniref:TetR/AcrR family transcriptional regulator n=1 Tax=Streptococcus thoraltensis TaxID=55085 RepID=UPI001F59B1C1|nr:TetR family transcriptional regulator [Streptococcus thoraltensis]
MLYLKESQETESAKRILSNKNNSSVFEFRGIMKEKIDLRLQKTYIALHTNFKQLLEEKRFEELTVNELCERSMIRRSTFYKHFTDKYDYFSFFLQEITASFRDSLSSKEITEDVGSYLTHMCRELVRFIKTNERLVQNIKTSDLFSVLMRIMLDEINSDFYRVLTQNYQETMTKSQLQGTAAFYAGGMINTLFQYLKQNSPIDENQFIDIITPHFHLEKTAHKMQR